MNRCRLLIIVSVLIFSTSAPVLIGSQSASHSSMNSSMRLIYRFQAFNMTSINPLNTEFTLTVLVWNRNAYNVSSTYDMTCDLFIPWSSMSNYERFQFGSFNTSACILDELTGVFKPGVATFALIGKLQENDTNSSSLGNGFYQIQGWSNSSFDKVFSISYLFYINSTVVLEHYTESIPANWGLVGNYPVEGEPAPISPSSTYTTSYSVTTSSPSTVTPIIFILAILVIISIVIGIGRSNQRKLILRRKQYSFSYDPKKLPRVSEPVNSQFQTKFTQQVRTVEESLINKVLCPSCGDKVELTDIFCASCGSRIK